MRIRRFSMCHVLPNELVKALEKDLIMLLTIDRKDLSERDSKRILSCANRQARVIYVIKDDLVGSKLTPAELSVILWHEYWHIHANTGDEASCDQCAIDHMGQDTYHSTLSKTKNLIKILGGRECGSFDGKYAHRKDC